MSLITEPNYNRYIERIAEIWQKSTLLMPATNGDLTKQNLVRQIIKYKLPIPESPPEGLGPPHIFIALSPNPIYRKVKRGRDNRDQTGPEKLTLEFYCVVVAQKHEDPLKTQSQLFDIIEAATTSIKKNKRLTDSAGLNPLAADLDYIILPYILDNDANDIHAQNIVLRPSVFVNLRT